MKKFIAIALVLVLALTCFTACGEKETAAKVIKIAVPNDTTNEARALKLLEVQGVFTLKDPGDGNYTAKDIADNPNNVEIVEVEAAQVPSFLPDVSYAVINCNYAIEAGLTPFVAEGTDVSYPNVVCVKAGNENTDKTKALVAAVNSQTVKDYINDTFKGAIACDLENVTDGFDPSVDYAALAGTKITVAASPVPHADILRAAKEVLAQKDVILEVIEFADYVQPNEVVESGEVDANYFAHIPYQEDFNAQNGTHLNWVLKVHHEPMGVYSSQFSNWDGLK